jgi:DNA-binding XRE family transcriptional regulator
MISAAQCRAARAMMNWPRETLATASGVHLRTIVDFEREARQPRGTTLLALQNALSEAGATFLADDGRGIGVRFLRRSVD